MSTRSPSSPAATAKGAAKPLTVADINQFLRQQPHLASQIVLPNHGQRPSENSHAGGENTSNGQVLSLHAAKSQKSLRELLGLKKQQAEFVQTVASNEAVLNQVHAAALDILSARTLSSFAKCLSHKWPATLGITAGAFVQPKQLGFDHLAQKLTKNSIALFPLGELPQTALEALFGAKLAKQLIGGSACAMALHNTRGSLKGIVLLADANPETYYAGQDVALANFLRQVAEKQLVGVN